MKATCAYCDVYAEWTYLDPTTPKQTRRVVCGSHARSMMDEMHARGISLVVRPLEKPADPTLDHQDYHERRRRGIFER